MDTPSYDDLFSSFRIAYLLVGVLAAALLWRRPRAGVALAALIAVNLVAWAVYTWPLGRLYALNELSDMGFNVGAAACASATGNPFDHTQTGFTHLEPFWSGMWALVTLGQPELVLPLYRWFSPFSIAVVALGLYFGLRDRDDEADRWERVLIVLAVLGLSSWSQTQRPPIPALWAGNFLLKPNHACAWALVGLAFGLAARRVRPWILGLVLGLMTWVFILDWAFLAAGLGLGTFLRADRTRADMVAMAKAIGLSLLIALPYIRHLTRDHSPLDEGGMQAQMWLDPLGQRLRAPEWVTADLGGLLVLGVLGALLCWRRRTGRDALVLGTFAAVWLTWVAYSVAARFGVAPEPDEHHYFLRITMALAAGVALAALARHLESWRGWRAGQGAVVVLAACWPLTFPAYWNPPSMDRYFAFNLDPIPPRVQRYAEWVRENTPRDAVFVTGRQAGTWIPVLAGRRILLARATRPPADYAARAEAEETILFSRDPRKIAEAARRFGVTHVAIDANLVEEYGEEAFKRLGQVPAFEMVYFDHLVRILKIRREGQPLARWRSPSAAAPSPARSGARATSRMAICCTMRATRLERIVSCPIT